MSKQLEEVRALHRREVIKVISCPEECNIHEDECPADNDFAVCAECYRFAEDDLGHYFEDPGSVDVVAWPCETAKRIYSADELMGG